MKNLFSDLLIPISVVFGVIITIMTVVMFGTYLEDVSYRQIKYLVDVGLSPKEAVCVVRRGACVLYEDKNGK